MVGYLNLGIAAGAGLPAPIDGVPGHSYKLAAATAHTSDRAVGADVAPVSLRTSVFSNA